MNHSIFGSKHGSAPIPLSLLDFAMAGKSLMLVKPKPKPKPKLVIQPSTRTQALSPFLVFHQELLNNGFMKSRFDSLR
ncbi:hypothetical protein [Pectobacterium polaris]|uniref:hypothetical protein n=1 Tax=Pectobacterium polaris TaxID=2042057 RepID=UPI0013FE15D9|nr:hypothetical protein [Pectobacterium polaris]